MGDRPQWQSNKAQRNSVCYMAAMIPLIFRIWLLRSKALRNTIFLQYWLKIWRKKNSIWPINLFFLGNWTILKIEKGNFKTCTKSSVHWITLALLWEIISWRVVLIGLKWVYRSKSHQCSLLWPDTTAAMETAPQSTLLPVPLWSYTRSFNECVCKHGKASHIKRPFYPWGRGLPTGPWRSL